MNKQINWILPFTSIKYGFIIQHLKNQCLSIYHLFYKPMFMYLNVRKYMYVTQRNKQKKS